LVVEIAQASLVASLLGDVRVRVGISKIGRIIDHRLYVESLEEKIGP
jgi:hypothetical protein